MGVYIEGLNMPKDDCRASRELIITNNYVGNGKIEMLAYDGITNEFIGEVVEVPEPHGRLIDAEVLTKDLGKRWNINDDQDFCNKEVWRGIAEAPTVIEAEGEK